MAAPLTILVLDPQPTANVNVRQVLGDVDRLVVVVKTASLARHALQTMLVGVWICDITAPGVDFKSLFAIANCTNPMLRIIFTGPKTAKLKADNLITAGRGSCFVPRPWQAVELKKVVNDEIQKYIELTSTTGGKKVVVKNNRSVSTEPENEFVSERMKPGKDMLGPDPTRYTLINLIGTGGTGSVFLARDKFLEMDVAIKVINPDLLSDPAVMASFKDEARITMQLSHTGILRFYNFSTYNGCYYMVMEVLHGKSLRDILASNGPMDVESVLQVLLEAARPIDYVHSHNVIHKDLKPENIVITDAGEVKIIDFGTATLHNKIHENDVIVGTPEFMSPEQFRGDIVGPAGDIYALGIIAYMMFTGCFPFPVGTKLDDFFMGLRPSFTGVNSDVAAVLEKATNFEPEGRYSSATEFVYALASACNYSLG
ncbi:MAG: serine/threonine protein kinase [Kiritimatiellae bacterium]|nr:serine/threonine protein kinase [Kiritimatiellia bacterium]